MNSENRPQLCQSSFDQDKLKMFFFTEMLKLWLKLPWDFKESSCSKMLLLCNLRSEQMWCELTHERKIVLSLKTFIYVWNQGALSSDRIGADW